MGKHSFSTFSRADFASAARIFWDNGYRTVAEIRDVDSRGRDLFLSQAKTNFRVWELTFGYALISEDFRMVRASRADSGRIIDEF